MLVEGGRDAVVTNSLRRSAVVARRLIRRHKLRIVLIDFLRACGALSIVVVVVVVDVAAVPLPTTRPLAGGDMLSMDIFESCRMSSMTCVSSARGGRALMDVELKVDVGVDGVTSATRPLADRCHGRRV